MQRFREHVEMKAKPPARPTAMPPSDTSANSALAPTKEKPPVSTAATASL
jgi:hypothetical protein